MGANNSNQESNAEKNSFDYFYDSPKSNLIV